MAATFTNTSLLSPGATTRGHRVILSALLRGTTDYPTGGDPVTAATFGLRFIKFILPFDFAVTGAAGTQYELTWDKTASTIKTQVAATGVEAAAALAGLNALTGYLIVVGS